MKVFEDGKSWGRKINYVDENNVVLGFDMDQQCCENFGHGVFANPPQSLSDTEIVDVDLANYRFAADAKPVNCKSYDDEGGGLAFRIVADGLPDLYVAIWNHHNGYYSHGFNWKDESGSL
jgi:hypothetical protein